MLTILKKMEKMMGKKSNKEKSNKESECLLEKYESGHFDSLGYCLETGLHRVTGVHCMWVDEKTGEPVEL